MRKLKIRIALSRQFFEKKKKNSLPRRNVQLFPKKYIQNSWNILLFFREIVRWIFWLNLIDFFPEDWWEVKQLLIQCTVSLKRNRISADLEYILKGKISIFKCCNEFHKKARCYVTPNIANIFGYDTSKT